jgi:hypothetical protein
MGTIDRGGKPGRPATVRRTAERLIAECLRVHLDSSALVPCAMPKKVVQSVCSRIAASIIRDLQESDLHLVPGAIARELILLVGRGAVTPSHEKTESQLFRFGDSGGTAAQTANGDAGVPCTESMEGRGQDPG